MDNKNLKTRAMTAFAGGGAAPKNLKLTCHSEGTKVTEESMMCHCDKSTVSEAIAELYGRGYRLRQEVAEQPTWQSKENKILDCFAYARNDKKRKAAFTLAETMIVLVILGIVAAITIPALVRRHVESSNRTRIKKAMSVYDTAINKMVVENGIKNNDALINEFNADKNNNSCAKSRAYFKSAQDGANDCTFRASDGVWWNISDINHPIIAFNEDDLNKADEENNKAFKLVGYLDENGSLRVSDLAKAEGDNQEYLTKLYNFVNNKKETSSGETNKPTLADKCKSGEITCTKKTLEYTEVNEFFIGELCILDDSETNIQTCPYTSKAEAGDYYFTEPVTHENYESYLAPDSSICKECKKYGYNDYYNAAKRYCEAQGGRLPTLAELKAGGYTDGNFWAAEEYDSDNAYYLDSYGDVGFDIKYNVDNGGGCDVVCIGN